MQPTICGLTRWMDDRMVVCKSPIKAQMGEWKEASEKATEEVTIGLGLLSATEIRTNYFKL